LTPQLAGDGKSHTNLYIRQMLVDYYTKEFEKQEPAPPPQPTPVAARAKPQAKAPPPLRTTVAQRVQSSVAEVEAILASHPEPEPLQREIAEALKYDTLALEFAGFLAHHKAIAERRKRENQELLLFAMVL
jgi:hypothetical protein